MSDSSDRQNVVLINCHDLGQHLGCYGRDVHTPNLDEMAESGTRFENYFCTAPQCSPSRGSIMTGRHPHQNGLMGLAHLGWSLDDSETTLPQYLADAGYETHLFGLQHEGDPDRLGYDTVHDGSDSAHRVAERFERDVGELTGDEPFFASVGFYEPHRDYEQDWIPDAAYDRYDPDEVEPLPWLPDHQGIRNDIAALNAMITEVVDPAVGSILDTLDREGLTDDTIVVFTTDHGLAMPRAKGTCYDAGMETALLIRDPDRDAEGEVVDELLSNVDLLPTILDMVDVERPESIEGRSFRPLVEGGAYESRDRVFAEMTWHDRYNPIRAIRTDRFKYVRNFADLPRVYLPVDVFGSDAGRAVREEYYVAFRSVEEFYDLRADPHEQHNLAPERRIFEDEPEDLGMEPDVEAAFRRLRGELREWLERTDDSLLDGPVQIPRTEW